MTTDLLEAVIAFLVLLLVGGSIAVRLILWPLYARTRADLETVTRNRDGWRDVAQRALVVAQLHRSVTRRATTLTNRVVPK